MVFVVMFIVIIVFVVVLVFLLGIVGFVIVEVCEFLNVVYVGDMLNSFFSRIIIMGGF